MNAFIDQNARPSQRLSPFVWWIGYFFIAVLAQKYSNGKDFLTPAVLICLQSKRWWGAAWLALLCVFMHEGMGNLEFGISTLFYVGVFLFYFVARWLLEPKSPVFMFLYSLVLTVWLHSIVLGGVIFQELALAVTFSWGWVSIQWACYLIWWFLAMHAYQAWVRHGRS